MLKRKNRILWLGQFLALVASLLIAGQIGYIYFQGASLCLNGGCKVVEQLTRVSPLVINGVGLVFFQLVYWGLLAARGEPRRVPPIIGNVLLAALAAEAVLTGFQYLIAQTFCSYCLVIFGFVVLLNFVLGIRQVVAGILIFAATALAFASLDLTRTIPGKQAFSTGVFAQRPGLITSPKHHLFYSSNCAHCQRVIASLRNNVKLTVAFNPIDKVTEIDLPQVSYTATYEPAANSALLNSLGIDEIPVLMSRTPDGWIIRQGEAALLAYLNAPPVPVSGAVSSSQSGLPEIPGGSDGCRVSTDCSETSSGQSSLP